MIRRIRRIVMAPLGTRRRRKLPNALVRGALFLLLAVAVVCGTVQAGARYFYCEALGLSLSDPCAQGVEHRDQCPLASLDRPDVDCCSLLRIRSMPEGARASEPTVPPAGVIAVLPAIEGASGRSSRGGIRAVRATARWRKPPRSSGERRAELMVFLT
jgi:hypothetical protein